MIVAAVLVAGPLVITLLRAKSFEASVEIFPVRAGPYPPPRATGFYRRLAHDPVVLGAAVPVAGTNTPVSELDRGATVRRSGNGRTFTLTVSADTPEHARALTDALGAQMAATSSDRLVLGARPPDPPLTHAADRLVNALPGGFPPRPNPLLAALAGLAIASTVWLIWLARRPATSHTPGDLDYSSPRD